MLRDALVCGGRDIALRVQLKLYDSGDHSVVLGSGGVGENEVTAGALPPLKNKDPRRSATTPRQPASVHSLEVNKLSAGIY